MLDPVLAGQPLRHPHVCALRAGQREFAMLCAFLKEGMDAGEQSVRIAPAGALDAQRSCLAHAGADVAHGERTGNLKILSCDDIYLRCEGVLRAERILEDMEMLMRLARDAGYSRMRVVGDMDWALVAPHDLQAMWNYEAGADRLLRQWHQVGVCVYDMAGLTGEMLLLLLAAHPVVVSEGRLIESPFYAQHHED